MISGLEGRIQGLNAQVSAVQHQLARERRTLTARISELEGDLDRSSKLVTDLSRALDKYGGDSVASHNSGDSRFNRSPRKSSVVSSSSDVFTVAASLIPVEDEAELNSNIARSPASAKRSLSGGPMSPSVSADSALEGVVIERKNTVKYKSNNNSTRNVAGAFRETRLVVAFLTKH